ncbi:MAG: hypothetical protein NZM43_00465 [Saprospiraceae bacterium]|nr:hypothetical protein [Saprospiraceae bacterium]MDW8482774.1 hypothetical protein [Saprospiraceae bacterium]
MKTKRWYRSIVTVAILSSIFIMLFVSDMVGQCPMCRMSVESNLQNGGTAGRGLNAGILYMLAMPYLIVAIIGYWWWRNRRKTHVEAEDLLAERPAQYN